MTADLASRVTSAGPTGAPHRRSRSRRIVEPLIYLAPALTLLAVFVAYPLLRALWYSFNKATLLGGIAHFTGFSNYSAVLHTDFGTYALHSVYWTVGAVGCQLGLGTIGALLLNQRIPLRGIVRGLAMIPWATPSVLVALIWLWLLDPNHGIVNSMLTNLGIISHPIAWLSGQHTAMPTLIAIDTWQGVPFFAVMILAAMQAVSPELKESARIDGCGTFGVFRNVVLPQILPTVLITVVLRIIWTANYVDLAYILTGGGPGTATTTVPLQSYLTAYKAGDFGQGAAYAMIQALVLAVLIGIYMRLTRGGEAR